MHDTVEEQEQVQQNQLLNMERNDGSNIHLQQPLNPASEPNIQQMMMLQMMQKNNMINPQEYSQLNPQMYPPMYLPMNPKIHPHMSPPMNHHMSPHISPSISPRMSQHMSPSINPHIDVSRMPPYMLHQQYQPQMPEVHPSNDQESHSKTTETVDLSSDQESDNQLNLPNLPQIQPPKPPHQDPQPRETKKRKWSEVDQSSPQETKQEQFSGYPMMPYQQLQQQYLPPSPNLQYDMLIQQKYLSLRQDLGPIVMHEVHKTLTYQYYQQYLQDYQNLYKSRPDPLQNNPLASPVIAQQWYQTLTILYTQLMKMRQSGTSTRKPAAKRRKRSRKSTDSHQQDAETITITPDINQNGMQWPTEMPDPEEVAYWNDFVTRRGMSELANEDPVTFQLHLMAKRQELNEIMLTGTTSSGINAF